jgi:RNA-directed DNA polymerase
MKRFNNLFDKVCSIDNLILADNKARRGKKAKIDVINHIKEQDTNIIKLHFYLISKRFKTSEYTKFTIFDGKERTIYSLPYYPDRIVHHAIMNVLEPIFNSVFISKSYSCIKGRGIHGAANGVKKALNDVENTKYCLKLDITKFYPSINHDILKSLLRRKIKDNDMLWLLDEIIDSIEGVPIGNYNSQYFANFYLTYFDHWLKEVKQVKYYFRYADDMVILSNDKKYLHKLLYDIKEYLTVNLKLTVKSNYQIFPVKSRGIDFVGYVFYRLRV